MKRGAVIVDVAIDQGGCTETSRPTTHAEPTYVVDGVVHYCVANMPGAVANTSTFALNNVTLPYVCAIADKGYRQACLDDPHLMAGLNVHRGRITHAAVARDLGLPYTPARKRFSRPAEPRVAQAVRAPRRQLLVERGQLRPVRRDEHREQPRRLGRAGVLADRMGGARRLAPTLARLIDRDRAIVDLGADRAFEHIGDDRPSLV